MTLASKVNLQHPESSQVRRGLCLHQVWIQRDATVRRGRTFENQKNIGKHSPVVCRMPFSIIHRRDIAIVAIVLSLVILFIQLSSLNTSLKPPGPKMSVTHVVFFQFNSSASPGVINDVCVHSDYLNLTKFRWFKISSRMLALKDNCIHPTSKKPYIKSASGGTDNSPEGLQVCSDFSQNGCSCGTIALCRMVLRTLL